MILIVDDDPIIRSILKAILVRKKYDVLEADNGKNCLDKLGENIELIITDLNMPVMNGIDMVKWIRSHKNYSKIPVIFLSVEQRNEIISQTSEELQIQKWIKKPFTSDEILNAVSSLL